MAVAAVRLRPRQWLPAGRPCAVLAPSATPRAVSRGPTSVFPRLEGVGPTFDARGSTRCLRKTLGVCAKAQTPAADGAGREASLTPFPSMMQSTPRSATSSYGTTAHAPGRDDARMHDDETPTVTLRRLTNGYQVTQAIHVAATLGIADLLGDGPRDSEALARETAPQAPSLHRVLRALVTVALLHAGQ